MIFLFGLHISSTPGLRRSLIVFRYVVKRSIDIESSFPEQQMSKRLQLKFKTYVCEQGTSKAAGHSKTSPSD